MTRGEEDSVSRPAANAVVHTCLAFVCAAFLWPVASLIAVGLYIYRKAGPGYVPVAYVLVGVVAVVGAAVGAVSLILPVRKGLSKRARRSARLSVIIGVACLIVVWRAAPRRWRPREMPPVGTAIPIVYNAGYNVSIFGFEKGTGFQTDRYARIFRGLCRAGLVSRSTVVVPRRVSDEELLLVHTERWVGETHNPQIVADVFGAGMIAELPPGFVEDRFAAPFRFQTRGTVLAARLAVQKGLACTLGGGFAHAQRDFSEGFNLFADAPLAVATLRREGFAGNILMIDADVHHGQGNALYYQDDPTVFIIDIYNADIYPAVKQTVDLAIELGSGAGDEEYLAPLRAGLPEALDSFKPELVIYTAGVDCSEHDGLGSLAVSEDGIFQRDKLVIDEVTRRGIPLCITLAGGYWKGSDRPSIRMIRYAADRLQEPTTR